MTKALKFIVISNCGLFGKRIALKEIKKKNENIRILNSKAFYEDTLKS